MILRHRSSTKGCAPDTASTCVYRWVVPVAVTDTGYTKLSDYPYTPFEASMGGPLEASTGEPSTVSPRGLGG